ncbi:MAG: hypothetical protein GY710_08785 [Desulfobacteraceae bacterium]|nr:hypothetical protein [Desulfobacteraceae bacterium]
MQKQIEIVERNWEITREKFDMAVVAIERIPHGNIDLVRSGPDTFWDRRLVSKPKNGSVYGVGF